jgi:hypothetical protein
LHWVYPYRSIISVGQQLARATILTHLRGMCWAKYSDYR